MSEPPVRVLLADDHAILRSGLAMLLAAEPGFTVAGTAGDGEEAVARALALRPDVVLMDLSMPGLDGLAATARLKAAWPEARVLILTMHEDPGYMHRALEAGAMGYVFKRSADDTLLSALKAVAAGGRYVPAGAGVTAAPAGDEPLRRLSEREREVLGLIASGYTNMQVAERLFLSVRTVESHRANLMTKLGLGSRAELVAFALRRGLLVP